MVRIWSRGPATSATVREAFDGLAAERTIAYTTVMSTMDNLHTKGWLVRERDGKAYRYWPTLSREQAAIERIVAPIAGVGAVEVDVPTKTITIHHDNRAPARRLIDAIEDEGYHVADA